MLHFVLAYDSSTLNEFIAIWLHKGRMVFAFDCGSGKVEIESINHLNDDQWHAIEIQRQDNNATLWIDSHFEGFVIPPGSSRSLLEPMTDRWGFSSRNEIIFEYRWYLSFR